MNRIKKWFTSFFCTPPEFPWIRGGHCGLCGKWVPDALVSRYWQWTVCRKCAETTTFEEQQQRSKTMITDYMKERTDA